MSLRPPGGAWKVDLFARLVRFGRGLSAGGLAGLILFYGNLETAKKNSVDGRLSYVSMTFRFSGTAMLSPCLSD